MFRISAEFLRRTNRCLRIAKDILIVPRQEPTRADMIALEKLAKTDKRILKILPSYQQARIRDEPAGEILNSLKHLYIKQCDNIAEKLAGKRIKKWRNPTWISLLPKTAQAFLRCEEIWSKRYANEDHVYGFGNPYLGFQYVLFFNRRVGDIFSAANIGRQHSHPQLSNKCDPVSSQYNFGFWTKRSHQTRLMHEEDTYVLNTIVGFNLRNHLNRFERGNFSASGLVHDSQMPLLGDEVMEIDPPAFCEIANIDNLFKDYEWSEQRKRHGLSNKRIAKNVRGEDLTGDLQDKNDKIAYTALDVKNIVETYQGSCHLKKVPWLRRLCDLVKFRPDSFTIWDCFEIENGRVFFTDPVRVGNFLTARALMFRNVYYGEHTRSTGTILTKTVVAHHYQKGILSRNDFYVLTLEDIDRRIGTFVGDPNIMHVGDRPGNPQVETFATLEEAYRREKELFDRGIVLSAIEDVRGKIKPATHFLVRTPSGDILTFAEAYPKKTEIIHKICHISRPIYLMYLQNLHIPLDSYLQMREYKRQQFAQRGQLI